MEKSKVEEEDLDWLVDYTVMFLNSPSFKVPLFSFLDNNCIYFSDSDDGEEEYKKIHTEFVYFLDNLLEEHMKEIEITNEIFQEVIREGYNRKHCEIIKYLMSLQDLDNFKKIMIKRNKRLESEAVAILDLEKSEKTNEQNNVELPKDFNENDLSETEKNEILYALKISKDDNLKLLTNDNTEQEKELEQVLKISLEENNNINKMEKKELNEAINLSSNITQKYQTNQIQTSPKNLIPEQTFVAPKKHNILPPIQKNIEEEKLNINIENPEQRAKRLKEQRDRLLALKNKNNIKLLDKQNSSSSKNSLTTLEPLNIPENLKVSENNKNSISKRKSLFYDIKKALED